MRNGFAALLEMNAVSVGRYEPVDVAGIRADRLRLMDPFNGAYVFTNENDNGLTADVDKEIPNIVADFLHQKIIAAGSVSWPTLGRMENAENGDGSPEKSPGTNNPERSKRFLTFGIKRLAIPEEEISEYLTYNFARQAALQLRYNNWSDTTGFTDESRNADFSEFVRQKETLNKWAMSDDHLTLSIGILPEDANNKKWKPINDEWQEVMPHFKSLVHEKRQETWLSELQKLCEKRFEQDYRGIGVRNFYRTKLKAKKEIVSQIRRLVETDLITDWKNGVRSAYDLSKLLASLLDSSGERLKNMDDKIVQMRSSEEEAANRVDANNREWSRISLLGKLVGQPENMLNAQGDALFQQYVCRTRAEAWTFAKQLTEELIVELTDLKSQVEQTTSTIADAVKKYNERFAQRITDKGPDLREQLVRFYNPELVRNTTRNMVKDENEQRTQTNKVRLALIGMLGENPTFSLFNQRIGVSDFVDVLDKQSANNARIAHNNLVQNPKERLLDVSIIEKLRERFSGNSQELKSYVTELVSHAGNYLTFERSEMDKDRAAAQTAVRQLTVILPNAPEHQDFVNGLKAVFRGAATGNVEFVSSDVRPNEIILVNLTNLFPLRYVKQLGFLKQKYDLRASGSNAPRAKLELHTEGDGNQFPKLFIPAQSEVTRETIPYLLLANALGLVQTAANATTGASELVFVSKDADGFDTDPIPLGKTLTEAGAKLDRRSADLVRDYVSAQLETKENLLESKRADLRQGILAAVEAIKAERGNNIQDDVYRQFLEGGKKAVAILKRES